MKTMTALFEFSPDSKPEKPHEHQWQTRSNGTFCLGCGGIKLPEDEPPYPRPHGPRSEALKPAAQDLLFSTAVRNRLRAELRQSLKELKGE